MSEPSRENIANLAKILSAFEIVFVDGNKSFRIKEYNESLNSPDGYLVNLIETGQKAMVELQDFIKNYEAQAFRSTQLIAKLMDSIQLLQAVAEGVADKHDIQNYLAGKGNVVPFALDTQINPDQGR